MSSFHAHAMAALACTAVGGAVGDARMKDKKRDLCDMYVAVKRARMFGQRERVRVSRQLYRVSFQLETSHWQLLAASALFLPHTTVSAYIHPRTTTSKRWPPSTTPTRATNIPFSPISSPSSPSTNSVPSRYPHPYQSTMAPLTGRLILSSDLSQQWPDVSIPQRKLTAKYVLRRPVAQTTRRRGGASETVQDLSPLAHPPRDQSSLTLPP